MPLFFVGSISWEHDEKDGSYEKLLEEEQEEEEEEREEEALAEGGRGGGGGQKETEGVVENRMGDASHLENEGGEELGVKEQIVFNIDKKQGEQYGYIALAKAYMHLIMACCPHRSKS